MLESPPLATFINRIRALASVIAGMMKSAWQSHDLGKLLYYARLPRRPSQE